MSFVPSKALLGQVLDGEVASFGGRLFLVLQQPFDVFGKDVNFKINMVARLIITNNRVLPAMRYNGDLERVSLSHCRYGQAGAVDCNRSLHGYVLSQLVGESDPEPVSVALRLYGQDRAGAVDVALHHVAAKPFAHGKGAFEIDWTACAHLAERGPLKGFERGLGAEGVRSELDHRQVGAIDRY